MVNEEASERKFLACQGEPSKLFGIFLDKVRENRIRPQIVGGLRL